MERIALILMLFVLLLNGRHPQKVPPPRSAGIVVTARAIPLDQSDPSRRRLGELHYLGGWSLTADNAGFGGISSLRVEDDGRIVTLNDGSAVATFRAGLSSSRGLFHLLPSPPRPHGSPRLRADTESMAHDPVSGRSWVGVEGEGRICRYGPGLSVLEGCVIWPEALAWPTKTGMESLARLADGRFLAIAEEAPGPQGRDHDVLLFAGDPVDPETPPPARLSYIAPAGYLPTDAVAVGRDRLLVLNRRLTLADMFTAVIVLVDISNLHEWGALRGREVARFVAPLQHDNFEAMAISHERGQPILWIASDDNFLFFQRSLLLKFAMPRAWFVDDGQGGP